VVAQQLPLTSHRRRGGCLDRGAAAVEMALVLPVLLFIVMGVIDFGRAYSAQIQLSAAAREGVRLASLNTTGVTTGTAAANPDGDAAILARVQSAAAALSGVTAKTTYCPVPAAPTDNATVVVSSPFVWITGITAMSKFFGPTFPSPTTMRVTGVMRCTG
jgi:Flp pilus assembly protein TadG